MNILELKKLAKQLGGLLVMEGDKPGFVIVSYDKYNELLKNEIQPALLPELLFTSSSNINTPSVSEIAQDVQELADEERIKKLNEEIAILKQEIKDRETEELLLNQE